jgi:hypothetical protein
MGGACTFERNAFAAGTYFYRIASPHGVTASGKFIAQP